LFQNTEKYLGINQKSGLTYDPNETVADLVNKSTTGDGIPDWEKVLFGLDPTKTENVPGVPDSATIQEMMQENNPSGQTNTNQGGTPTKTDEFSRDLFAEVSAVSTQGQPIDQSTVDNISNSFAEKIQNPVVRKTFLISDIKTTNDNSAGVIQKYKNALIKIYTEYPTKTNVADVIKEFVGDGTNVNDAALQKLDPIITQLNGILTARIEMGVPSQLAQPHLDVINALERVIENLTDIKAYDSDPVVTIGAMNVYNNNTLTLQAALDDLANKITQKLKS